MKIIPKSYNKYWEQVVDKGFGDKNNVYIWSMKKFNGFLYIGTINDVKGCQIYRSESGNKGTWKQVNESGFGHGPDSAGARNMIVYKNLLWVVTSSWRIGTQVWITNGEESEIGGLPPITPFHLRFLVKPYTPLGLRACRIPARRIQHDNLC